MGDTPYVKAKRAQLVDKDPEKAIPLFWAAINAGDRVDSALKDMAIVMKQQNRAEEAIEAIKSLRVRCSDQAQESLDNILLDLYKRCGRLDDQIGLLKHKLRLIDQGLAFNGKRTKTARSQGRKFQVSVEQEATRLLGNLGWALMQKESYSDAEAAYRRALTIGPDNNKMCNLGICLMKQGRVSEAKDTLKQVKPAHSNALRGADSHLKAYERAQEMLGDLECRLRSGWDLEFKPFASSSIWQPQPCLDYPIQQQDKLKKNLCLVDENGVNGNSLNIDAPPFYSKVVQHQVGDLKRTRSMNAAEIPLETVEEGNWPGLPDNNEFEAAIVAAALAPVLEGSGCSPAFRDEKKVGKKRLRVFEDITLSMNSPRA